MVGGGPDARNRPRAWVVGLLAILAASTTVPGLGQAQPPAQGRVNFASRRVPEGANLATPPPEATRGADRTQAETRRIIVGDADGRVMVARVLGERGQDVVALLPDGRLGWPDGVVPTDRPFVADSADALQTRLLSGEFRGYTVHPTDHYLVFSRGSREFGDSSAQLLESLYRGLMVALARAGVPVHDAEFPLVAVIDPTERDFRARHGVSPEVRAYYHVPSNRIFFHEDSGRDRNAPDLAAMRRPQTVAHEGTHQILQNIGVQPRLAAWPAWLTEGLAEYCAPTTTRAGGDWASFGKVNPFHMATFRALSDPLSLVPTGPRRGTGVESLVNRPELSPTDYARSWALTHYLATARPEAFVDYLRVLGQLRPLERRTADQQLADFRAAFGRDLDRKVANYLGHLPEPEILPFYAVAFEQAMPEGLPLRATLVSQSPTEVRHWLEARYSPHGGMPNWEVVPHATRASALRHVRAWVGEP